MSAGGWAVDRRISFALPEAAEVRAGRWHQLRRPAGLPSRSSPGDRLWMCEPFHLPAGFDHFAPLQALAIGGADLALHFAADGPPPATFGRHRFARELPKARHRAHLIVRETRTERLQAITDADAIRAGHRDRAAFAAAWDVVHSPGARSISGTATRWADDPLIVVITFDFIARPL